VGRFTAQDIQELLKDLMPSAQVVSSLPNIKNCKDRQIIVVIDKNGGISVYLCASGSFVLLASTSGTSVTSVFGRKGAVVAQKGDYAAEMIATDANNRFVTDEQISQWSSAIAIRSQTGSRAVTANNLVTITFPYGDFMSTPVVDVDLCGTDGSMEPINKTHLIISTSTFTVPAADIILDGTIYWKAGI
jgi:hypothetical protein